MMMNSVNFFGGNGALQPKRYFGDSFGQSIEHRPLRLKTGVIVLRLTRASQITEAAMSIPAAAMKNMKNINGAPPRASQAPSATNSSLIPGCP